MKTIVDFTHPEQNSDPEYFDMDLGFVECQNEINLKIDVSLSIVVNDEEEPVKIEALEFRNASFIDIKLDPCWDDWYEF